MFYQKNIDKEQVYYLTLNTNYQKLTETLKYYKDVLALSKIYLKDNGSIRKLSFMENDINQFRYKGFMRKYG